MSDLSGQRVTHDGRRAPVLMVRYRCPSCIEDNIVLDAYGGAPSHVHGSIKVFLSPVELEKLEVGGGS